MNAAVGPAENLDRRDWIIALAVAVALFAVYALGACRTIYVGDSGELAAAAYVLGVPHPTGYPLYVLLGKLWTLLLPLGSVAFRLSLFSAASAALACGALFLVCRRLGLGALAALTAALSLAFAPSYWGEANIQRVYALNALALGAAMLAACTWWRRRSLSSFSLTVFLAALGACNHTSMVFFLVAFAVVALVVDPTFVLQARSALAAALAVVAGLLPYLFLPLAPLFDPPVQWGAPDTLEGFFDIVLRRGFWSSAWVESAGDYAAVAVDYLISFARELTWVGVGLMAVGLVAVLWQRRALALLIFLTMLANVAMLALHGSRNDLFVWHRYYIPSYFMAALLIGAGADLLSHRLPFLLRVLPLALPLFLLADGWQRFDRGEFALAEDFSRQVLAEAPQGAVIEAADDSVIFVLLYLKFVEQVRPDVSVVLHGTYPVPPAASFDPEATPILFTHDPALNDPGLVIVATGLTFRVWRADLSPPHFKAPPEELPGEDSPAVKADFLAQNLVGQYHFMLAVTYEQIDWALALRHLERAAAAAPGDDVLAYSLGVLYFRNGLFAESLASFERSAKINPRDLVNAPGTRAADAAAQLRAEMERLAAVEAQLRGSADAPASADPQYHERMAALLEESGEPLAARGHRRRAAVTAP